jgi:hypothetical protein
MNRRTDLLTIVLSVTTLLGCGLLGLVGVGLAAMGIYGFVVGVHGGPLVAGIMLLFGAGLAFASYSVAKTFFKSERKSSQGAGH